MTSKRTNIIASIPDERIMNKIMVIRNERVMIDRDLAELYGITTKRLNEQVKKNAKRFPSHFMFQLTQEEKNYMVANCDHLEKIKRNLLEQDQKILLVFEYLKQFEEMKQEEEDLKNRKRIGYKRQNEQH